MEAICPTIELDMLRILIERSSVPAIFIFFGGVSSTGGPGVLDLDWNEDGLKSRHILLCIRCIVRVSH